LGGYTRKILSLVRWKDEGLSASDRRQIVRGTLHSFLIQGFSVLLVFASNLFLVRSSDPGSYGLYVHVFNWVSILSIVVLGGRDDLVLAQLPRYADDQHARLVGLVRAVNRWILVAAVVVGGVFSVLLYTVRIDTLSEHQALFRLAVVAVYLTACLSLNQLILQALHHIRLSQVIEKLVKPLLLIAAVGLMRVLAIPFSAGALVILSTVVLAICCCSVGWVVYRKVWHGGVIDKVEAAEPLSGKTFYFFVISLMNLLSTKVTMLIMPAWLATKDIGVFNISYRFADLLIFPFFLMHTVLPQLFARHTTTGRAYTQSLFSESNRLMILLSLPLLLGNVLAGRFLLHIFGAAFEAGYAAMIYISLAQFLFSLFGPANTILMMQDREKYAAVCLVGYVLVLAGMSRWLIPVYGITGGAVAILISSGVYNISLAIVTWRVCGIGSPLIAGMHRRILRRKI
jgi:O-antigen/teichoic acid export membrane protein